MMQQTPHIPVLLDAVIAGLNLHEDGHYVDATFGCGGYSQAMLAEDVAHVTAFDRDPAAKPHADILSSRFPGKFTFHQACFSRMGEHLPQADIQGIAFDLGVSSPQLDVAERGFSFRLNGALDMRMGSDGITAADVVNTYAERDLADIIYTYGEERHSRRIARAIVARRAEQPFLETLDFAAVVRRAAGRCKDGIDPATRTFQALRIYVNRELEELEQGLLAAEQMLAPKGRLAVVSFHSLEDRIVKQFLNTRTGNNTGSRHAPITAQHDAIFSLPQKKPFTASEGELKANPRSRSAKLRLAEKISSAEAETSRTQQKKQRLNPCRN